MDRFQECLNTVLHHEGGYVDHPSDPGGMTNLGVTRRVLESWLGRSVTEDEMRSLTPKDVEPIYRARYWRLVDGDNLPPGLDLVVFDFGVNAGPSRAVRLLQEYVGTSQDGLMGPNTLSTVNSFVNAHGLDTLIQAYSQARREYYRSLSHFDTFGRGWLRRTDEVEAQALGMIT